MLELIDGRAIEGPVPLLRPSPPGDAGLAEAAAAEAVQAVRMRGDAALLELTERFDGVRVTTLRVPVETLGSARGLISPELLGALEALAARLDEASRSRVVSDDLTESGGVLTGEVVRPLRRVGIYVPGGRATYPSSVLMAAIPARVAGVGGIAVCSPPGRSGLPPEPVLAACAIAGVEEVYAIGGAQAIAALAYGTETVRPVDKIVGPGNVYVTAAKKIVRGWVGTDADAGPTEIVIVADDSANPLHLALDLLAQAEHGPLGSHVLITDSETLITEVEEALDTELITHARSEDVENALIEGGKAVLVRDLDHGLATANSFAPEHLQLSVADPRSALPKVQNAGSVFLGPTTPVAVGDYVGSSNHVLPTGGSARWSSGLSVMDFMKRIYVTSMTTDALAEVAPQIEALAEAEGFAAHSRSVQVRLEES